MTNSEKKLSGKEIEGFIVEIAYFLTFIWVMIIFLIIFVLDWPLSSGFESFLKIYIVVWLIFVGLSLCTEHGTEETTNNTPKSTVHIQENSYGRLCPSCKGSGRCSYCGGSGHFNYQPRQKVKLYTDCTFCIGTGVCTTCKGQGRV